MRLFAGKTVNSTQSYCQEYRFADMEVTLTKLTLKHLQNSWGQETQATFNRNINNIKTITGNIWRKKKKKAKSGGGTKEDKIKCLNDTIQFWCWSKWPYKGLIKLQDNYHEIDHAEIKRNMIQVTLNSWTNHAPIALHITTMIPLAHSRTSTTSYKSTCILQNALPPTYSKFC